MLLENKVKKIFIAISSPRIINKNNFGIDIPTKEELLCNNKTNDEIEKCLKIEKIIFQDLNDLKNSICYFWKLNHNFEDSVFNE